MLFRLFFLFQMFLRYKDCCLGKCSIPKKIVNNFKVEKTFGQHVMSKKFQVHMKLGSKKLLVHKNFVSEALFGQQIFGPKLCWSKIFGLKNVDLKFFWFKTIQGQTNLGSKYFQVQKNFRSKKILVKKMAKYTWVHKNFVPKIFLVKIFFGPI